MLKRVVIVCCFDAMQLCEKELNAFDESKAMAMVFFSLLLLAKTPPP